MQVKSSSRTLLDKHFGSYRGQYLSTSIPPVLPGTYPPNSASKWMTVVFFLPARVELGRLEQSD